MKVTAIDKCNVYYFKSGFIPPFQLDIYFFIADGLMIDAGSANIVGKASKLLSRQNIHAVVLTHIHEDHTGLAQWLYKEKKVPIYIHNNSIQEASQDSDIPLYRRLVWGNRKAFTALPVPKVIKTEYYTFDVYEAPGHHRDHIVLHEKTMGWLFTGDIYISSRQLVAFKDENINDEINTLEKLLKLDFDTLFCSHTGVHNHAREKIKRKLDYFKNIQEQVKVLKQKGLTVEEIDRKLFPKKNLWTFVSGGEWSSLNIVKTVN
ncbi:MAG: MBL fold metallo-hydrolase [Spirochaetes bacterium]|nr:MBL fold metallo-hydrolase [Spirochaetota bacterium]